MRIIDADALINGILTEWGIDPEYCKSFDIDGIKAYADDLILQRINEQPTVDAVPVVRCKDCQWFDKDSDMYDAYCDKNGIAVDDDFYCADGERKDGENNADS